MEMREGNRILHLKGSPYEMGYQHGVLLKEDIVQGVVPVFADPVSGLSTYRSLPKWVRSLMLLYLDFTVYSPVERNQPREYLSELKGIADGSGTDFICHRVLSDERKNSSGRVADLQPARNPNSHHAR
jgi:hypothetical protein